MTKANRRKRRRESLPPYESSEQLQARLWAFAMATREQAMRPRTVAFPDHVTVLAGPLRRVRTAPGEPGEATLPASAPAPESD
ncbi:hypothetical protein [Paraburkholderia sp. C35]|uniref:hypothetical protein n=1 Tax=Paraburkholderia sp. C35 TaxID=2126993 RepID=UPI000D69017B|nr:hypothetical protein [Paraburkholderia sp. C35]